MFYLIIQISLILIFIARLINLVFFYFKKYNPKIIWFLTSISLEDYELEKFSSKTLTKLKIIFTIETFFVVGGTNIILFYLHHFNSDMRLFLIFFLYISNFFFNKWINKVLTFEKSELQF
ncbi:hypothetical protein CAR_c22210 [Carnobacterium sp. 17-4]|nr:hypothetical protein CAR_c22210 [Carnobacterium sp. 17-4]